MAQDISYAGQPKYRNFANQVAGHSASNNVMMGGQMHNRMMNGSNGLTGQASSPSPANGGGYGFMV